MAVFAVRAQVASKQCSVLVSHRVSDKTMAAHVSVRFPLLHVRPWPRYHIAPAIQPLWAAIFAIFLLLTERGYCGTPSRAQLHFLPTPARDVVMLLVY